MAHIVVLGAGIGGVAAAIEVREGLSKATSGYGRFGHSRISSSRRPTRGSRCNWRKPDELKVPLAPVFKKKKIDFIPRRRQARSSGRKPSSN